MEAMTMGAALAVRADDLPALIVARLEEAGATLLALPPSGWSTGMGTGWPDVVHDAVEAYGWTGAETRPARPQAEAISRMDEAMAWLGAIPSDRFTLRRVVGARALVSPRTQNHIFSWRKLGDVLRADYRVVQAWHAQGIDLIASAMRARKFHPNA
jgi:hypothetical protein